MMYGSTMVTEGLPLRRQERGTDQGILAGADFLSVFMESSLRRAYSETTSTTHATTIFDLDDYTAQYVPIKNFFRKSRSTSPYAQTSTEEQYNFSDINSKSSDDVKDGVILAVRVSSSVGKSINNHHNLGVSIDGTTLSENLTIPPATELSDQNFVASEEHPSIIAKSSKSELSVDEGEPITKESDPTHEFNTGYPASVRELPSQSSTSFDPTAAFLDPDSNKDARPYHQTLIYHNNPGENGRARSVSYSTVIQALPPTPAEGDKRVSHARHERNYNGAHNPYTNNFEFDEARRIQNDTKNYQQQSNDNKENNERKNWHKPLADITRKTSVTTERNWESQEKPYMAPSPTPGHLSKVYSQPEQNYEVDEAVSVDTNGRAHGVQPSLPPTAVKRPDDNKKVGYVVEGRNYRKYRVEERTSDGFIVGEYGVVSHDDGSLRGVRYTADGTINPKLISEALLKFLSL